MNTEKQILDLFDEKEEVVEKKKEQPKTVVQESSTKKSSLIKKITLNESRTINFEKVEISLEVEVNSSVNEAFQEGRKALEKMLEIQFNSLKKSQIERKERVENEEKEELSLLEDRTVPEWFDMENEERVFKNLTKEELKFFLTRSKITDDERKSAEFCFKKFEVVSPVTTNQPSSNGGSDVKSLSNEELLNTALPKMMKLYDSSKPKIYESCNKKELNFISKQMKLATGYQKAVAEEILSRNLI